MSLRALAVHGLRGTCEARVRLAVVAMDKTWVVTRKMELGSILSRVFLFLLQAYNDAFWWGSLKGIAHFARIEKKERAIGPGFEDRPTASGGAILDHSTTAQWLVAVSFYFFWVKIVPIKCKVWVIIFIQNSSHS